MRTMRRNKRLIYICHKQEINGLVKYDKPIPIKVNYKSVKNDTELIVTGIDFPDKLRIKSDIRICVNGKWMNTTDFYHYGDRAYVYINPPTKHDVLCKNADYEVSIETAYGTTINQAEIILQRLSGTKG